MLSRYAQRQIALLNARCGKMFESWFYDNSSKEDISNENISKEEMPKINILKIYRKKNA
jgi:hypothetical protein